MKIHFLKMINYDQYANLLMLKSIQEINAPGKPVQLLSHLLAAQQIWLNRCKGLSAANIVLWPNWEVNTLEQIISDNNSQWKDFLNQQQPADFERIISYQNTKGENFQNQLSDIIAHVINHGTHHRAQIGQHLKLSGLQKLPVTDYIIYLRENGL